MKYTITSMAYGRSKFIDNIRNQLGGALQEFACREFSLMIGEGDHWTKEISKLVSIVPKYMSKSVKTKKGFKHKDAALREAFYESTLNQIKVLNAKHKIEKYLFDNYSDTKEFKVKSRKLLSTTLDAEELFFKMVEEFLPEYKHYLKRSKRG